MVVALGPGKFYGSSLPRPRFYTDVKFNSERINPPPCVTEPLLLWAADAHWSMGGHSFDRLRLQGRIEGSVKKLRAQLDEQAKKRLLNLSPPVNPIKKPSTDEKIPSSPDSEEESGSTLAEMVLRRKRKRKLGDVFDRIASEEEEKVSVIAAASEETVSAARSPVKRLKRKQVVARRTSPRKKSV